MIKNLLELLRTMRLLIFDIRKNRRVFEHYLERLGDFQIRLASSGSHSENLNYSRINNLLREQMAFTVLAFQLT